MSASILDPRMIDPSKTLTINSDTSFSNLTAVAITVPGATSSNWTDTFNIVKNLSSEWNSTYNTVQGLSSTWEESLLIDEISATNFDLLTSIDDLYTFLETNSASWGLSATGTMVVDVSSSNAALRVTQRGSGNVIEIEDDANPDSTPFVINNVGQIISGVTTAFNPTAGLQITSDSSDAPNASINIRRCSDTTSPTFILTKTRGSGASPASVQAEDQIGRIQYTGFNGTQNGSVAAIQGHVDGAVSATSIPGRLTLLTAPTGSLSTIERMRIDSQGCVGIGTTAPNELLTVAGNISATGTVYSANTLTTSICAISGNSITPFVMNFTNGLLTSITF